MKEVSYGIIPYLLTDKGVKIMLCSTSSKSDWGFVKGKIDKNETPKKCCKREVFEEIGVKIDTKDLEHPLFQHNKKKDIYVYFIEWSKYKKKSLKIAKKELHSVKWFQLHRLPTINKNQQLIITNILNRFNKIHFYHRKIH